METIVIIDFGGQYTQLIARRIRSFQVFSRVLPYTASLKDIMDIRPAGIILSGGPASVLDSGAPSCDSALFSQEIPVLGICYGMQLMAHLMGGGVKAASRREYGLVNVEADRGLKLFRDFAEHNECWMSHTYQVSTLPEGFRTAASSDNCPIAAMADEHRRLFGVQFHPEVNHTRNGTFLLRRFLFDVCGCAGDWRMADFARQQIDMIRSEVGEKGTVLLALSGGVDSAVAAALLSRAIGKRLTCVFVDHGLLRKGEFEQVSETFRRDFDMNLRAVDASERFLSALKGVTDPEEKRRIIGAEFLEVFKAEAKELGRLDHFAQGTIYPDVIESGGALGSSVIKSHHNVGGLPKELGFTSLIEPLRMLFKDEVRALGLTLGLPRAIVLRQPFPGPGLAIRIIGEVTREKAEIVREADFILRDEMSSAGLDREASQYFAVLTNMRSVGVMGDERTYDWAVAIRAVTTDDFMTADWYRFPYDILARVSSRIVNEVRHVNRVLLDVTTKPPASIEWE